nr:alpha/beta hydrolase [Sphingomonas sp. Y57]
MNETPPCKFTGPEVDPQLAELLEKLPTRHLSLDTLAEFRATSLIDPSPPREVGISWYQILSDPRGSASVFVYRPPGKGPFPCIYYIHGGGLVAGRAGDLHGFLAPLTLELSCIIVSVEYRLAPEHPFPAAIDDCHAGLVWTFENAARLGIDPRCIGVMGASAGGGLAASLALLVRDQAIYQLTFQHLIYPMLDDRTGTTRAAGAFVGRHVWTAQNNSFGWQSYLRDLAGSEKVPPYAAAARASDLSDLPPTLLAVGALDLFVEENMEYARRLIIAGVPTELHIYPGAYHGFDLAPSAAVAADCREASLKSLRSVMARAQAIAPPSTISCVPVT